MTQSKRLWLTISALVLLAHLVLLALLEGLLGSPFSPSSQARPVSVQLLAPPPPLPLPKKPSVSPKPAPAPQIAADPQIAAADPRPELVQAPDSSTDALASSNQELPIEEFFDSSLDPLGGGPQADELIESGGVAMTAYWGDYTSGSPIGHSTIELSFPQPDRYQVKMVTEAAGWARLFASAPMLAEAQGSLGPGGFLPERYSHKGPRRSEVTVFDYEKNEIRYDSLKEPLPLLKGIQDRLTFMLQLAWMLQADPDRFGLGQIVTVPIAGRNKIEEVDFVVLSDADLALPGGVLVPALHLSSNRQTNRYSVQIDVWMDRTDRLLPVRVRFEEARGTVLDLLTARN